MEPLPQILPSPACAIADPETPAVATPPAVSAQRPPGRLAQAASAIGLGPAASAALRNWIGILSAYFTAQTLTQLAGLVAGLLLVRYMAVQQFALYTLATSVVSFFTFASDLGSTSSLLYFFQRTAKSGEDFQPYLAAVLSLRRSAFLLGAAGVLIAFPRSAIGKGFDVGDVLAVTAGLLLCVWFQIASSVRLLASRLVGQYGRSYRAEVAGGSIRLVMSLLMVGTSLLRASLGMLGSALGAAATAKLAGSTGAMTVRRTPAVLGPYRRQILRYLLPTLPGAVYFSIQGPLVVWLAATFGPARNIAEVGALGRLGLIVGMFSGLTSVVLLPRMARIVDDRLYWRRYLQYGGFLLLIALGLLAIALLVPGVPLLILGKQYVGLHRELVLVVASAGLTLLAGYAVGVNFARSWNRWISVAVVLLVAAQACFVAVLPLSTTAGVLLFNLLSTATGLLLQLVITAIGVRRPHWVQWMH